MRPSATLAKFESYIYNTARRHLSERGYVELFPPRVVRASGACENIDTLFTVAGAGDERWWQAADGSKLPAYLAQTGQLYLEALVPELGKTYCVGQSFRAEPATDNRHLSEFTMVEIEFSGGFEQLLHEIQEYVKALADSVVSRRDLATHEWGLTESTINRLRGLVRTFPRITYDEAIAMLAQQGENIKWGDDISSAREQKLVQTFGNQPLFITHFPDPMWPEHKNLEVEKFFNMLPDANTPGRVLSCDLILPFAGESVGAAARVHDPVVMKDRLVNSKMFRRLLAKGGSIDDFAWYLERVAEKSVPHAGCGFGMARILQWLRGADSVTDSVTFPSNRARLI